MSLAAIGLIMGLLVAFGATRLLAALLYGVDPSDPLVISRGHVAAGRGRVCGLLFSRAACGENRSGRRAAV